ncbi:MAG: hypothetical protein K6G82_06665 [Ruminococcus sp.]|nr:hypothetical protein [Ruminococcus sp.]
MKFDVKRIDENTTKLTSVEYGDEYYITRKDYQFYLEKIDPPCNDATWIATLSTFELAINTLLIYARIKYESEKCPKSEEIVQDKEADKEDKGGAMK